MGYKGNLVAGLFVAFNANALASGVDYSGVWAIDLRSVEQKTQKAECGSAHFALTQDGDIVTGSHAFNAVGCGRANEGGPETVKGLVVGGVAVLVVTSSRTGDMAMGKAVRKGNGLQWNVVHTFQNCDTCGGDSPLILNKGLLRLTSASAPSK